MIQKKHLKMYQIF